MDRATEPGLHGPLNVPGTAAATGEDDESAGASGAPPSAIPPDVLPAGPKR